MSATFKKYYESPTVEVVEVQIKNAVLQGSSKAEGMIWEI